MNPRRHKPFSPARIWAMAVNTFTQLVRMKVFYFLLIFCAAMIASSMFFLDYSFEQELKILSDMSLGAMQLFSVIFAVVATALLIPKDVEDRTLYGILAKPVPRLEYLLGKFVGVVLLIAVSLLLMDVLFSVVLYARQEILVARQSGEGEAGREVAEIIRGQGLRWELLAAVAAIFFKACVLTAIALLISTFATSTLFTIVITAVVFFIGHFQAMARDHWEKALDPNALTEILVRLIVVIFPDFQSFNIVDAVVAGESVPAGILLGMAGAALSYVVVYLAVAYLVFFDKEL